MNKTIITALAVYAGVGLQAQAQVSSWPPVLNVATMPNANGTVGGVVNPISTTKLGLLNISLNNQFQAYQTATSPKHYGIEVSPNDPRIIGGVNWDNLSYTYGSAMGCAGTITYRSASRVINNATIIGAINKALSWPVGKGLAGADPGVTGGPLNAIGSPYAGQFNTTAKIVVVNYDNGNVMPPYPSTQDYVGNEALVGFDTAVWNAPWWLAGLPDATQANGTVVPLNWPNQNYSSWGKPWYDANNNVDAWVGARVFIIDPRNTNPNLWCFDVTPFFALEESYCYYCWDTMDRVTDGTISYGTASVPPCQNVVNPTCAATGSGNTKFYWTLKFNNVQGGWVDDANGPNYVLSSGIKAGSLYYDNICGFGPAFGNTYGWKLDDADFAGSQYALDFAVSGVTIYSTWKFQTLSDGANWPMARYSMTAGGHGFSPMCGVYSGTVTMTEYDRENTQFGGVWCVAP
jgi:hypothetical protein